MEPEKDIFDQWSDEREKKSWIVIRPNFLTSMGQMYILNIESNSKVLCMNGIRPFIVSKYNTQSKIVNKLFEVRGCINLAKVEVDTLLVHIHVGNIVSFHIIGKCFPSMGQVGRVNGDRRRNHFVQMVGNCTPFNFIKYSFK